MFAPGPGTSGQAQSKGLNSQWSGLTTCTPLPRANRGYPLTQRLLPQDAGPLPG